MNRQAFRSLAAVLAVSLPPGTLAAQGSLDPSVAPRAVMLDRQGDRTMATEMLGRYLATAPDDGVAWLHLGRFYLADARDWHLRGHVGEPSGPVYLDFAATALDQSNRLLVDSAIVFRMMVEMGRARVFVESFGWDAARERRPRDPAPPMPDYILELGINLLVSCPARGVLLTGNDLETLSVWYASLEGGHRPDVIPVDPRLYTTDSLYRAQVATSMGVDPALPIRQALAEVAAQRPLCLAPFADPAAVPPTSFVPVRLVRVHAADSTLTEDVLSLSRLIETERRGGTVWSPEIIRVYAAAARQNQLLCIGLLAPLSDRPIGACGH